MPLPLHYNYNSVSGAQWQGVNGWANRKIEAWSDPGRKLNHITINNTGIKQQLQICLVQVHPVRFIFKMFKLICNRVTRVSAHVLLLMNDNGLIYHAGKGVSEHVKEKAHVPVDFHSAPATCSGLQANHCGTQEPPRPFFFCNSPESNLIEKL